MQRFLFTAIIVSAFGASAKADVVAFWRFEEGQAGSAATGVGSVLDSSGNGLNGTPFLNPTYRAVPIQNSTLGLQFTGGTQRVFVPDSPVLALTKSLTLEAFIRFDGIPAGNLFRSQILFRGDDRNFLDPYTLDVTSDGRIEFHVENGSGQISSVISPTPIPIGQFIHVAGTLDDTTGIQSVYVNGVRVASLITNIRPFGTLQAGLTPGVGIGNIQSGGGPQSFGGIIDEVRISDVALLPGQFLNGGAVPEPGSLACTALGLACVAGYGRWRQKRCA